MHSTKIVLNAKKYNRSDRINNTKLKNMTKVSKNHNQSENIDTDTDGYTVLYAVFKLCQGITYIDPFTREKRKEKIQGLAGYIPCFETIEEAEENACNGKFEIVAIRRV